MARRLDLPERTNDFHGRAAARFENISGMWIASNSPQEESPMKIVRPFYLVLVCSTLVAACASVKEVGPTAQTASGERSPKAAGTKTAPEAKTMSCKGCKAATDSLKSARAAAQEALQTDDKDKLKAALQKADAQMAKMEGHKEKCMAMMKESADPDTTSAATPPAESGHSKHH
jgi:flagellar motility protein MotE (MotC chaperone)